MTLPPTFTIIQDLGQDLRYGLRSLRRSTAFTALVVLTLALGIGANGAIFSVIDAVLLRPLPVRDPGGLVLLSDGLSSGRSDGQQSGRLDYFTYPLYLRLRADNQVFDGLATQDSDSTAAVVRAGGPADPQGFDLAQGRCVSASFFDVMGVSAYRGRTFLPEDETAPGANPVMVLSHGYWQRRFGGDPAVIGSRLTVNGHQYTVLGVTAPGFAGPNVGDPTDFWVPMTMQPALMRGRSMLELRNEWWLLVFGRSKPGISLAAAEANVNLILQQYLAENPALAPDAATRKAITIGLEPGGMGTSGIRKNFQAPLLILMAGVALVLLIVCLNVSHLLLARAINRQREMSIRTALGASRARLLRQLLAEGLLLSALGGAAGALATGWLSDGLLSLASLNVVGVRIDGRVLSFVALLALGTAILLGLVPAWHASRADLQQALRATSSAVTGGGPRRLVSRILLTSQVAFSVVLLVGAGLLASSLGKLRNVDKGFDEEHLLLVSIFTRLAGVEKAQALPLNDEILQRVTALPGVRGASLSFGEILGGGRVTEVIFVPGGNESIYPHVFTVTPAYFAAVGMTMARGRTLRDNDRQGAPPVAVVNESLARKLFGGADAVGKYFRFDPARSPGQSKENILVVGVVRNARVNNLRNQPGPIVYLPVAQAPRLLGNLQVRTFADPARLGDQVRRAIEEGHPGLAVSSVRTMSTQVDRSLAQQRLLAALATAFGLTALFLVCVGLYGVIAQWAAQRTQEIGVRMALGASGGRVRWMVLRQAFALVLVGVVVGLPAAMVASRVLHTFLFGLTPSDPGTLTAAALLMFAVASLAAYLPARRASHIDPMVALRCE